MIMTGRKEETNQHTHTHTTYLNSNHHHHDNTSCNTCWQRERERERMSVCTHTHQQEGWHTQERQISKFFRLRRRVGTFYYTVWVYLPLPLCPSLYRQTERQTDIVITYHTQLHTLHHTSALLLWAVAAVNCQSYRVRTSPNEYTCCKHISLQSLPPPSHPLSNSIDTILCYSL